MCYNYKLLTSGEHAGITNDQQIAQNLCYVLPNSYFRFASMTSLNPLHLSSPPFSVFSPPWFTMSPKRTVADTPGFYKFTIVFEHTQTDVV